MDRTFAVESASTVRALIARVILGAQSCEPPLGSIHLQPHQVSSIARLEGALAEFGGALLCDDVGMGKTFVALAIARRFPRRLVVAPAGLREMWRDALSRAGVDAGFITFEAISRSEPTVLAPDLLIVDESHHARNPRTRRYGRIARLARDARVLMLTATPIHNRRADLVALLALFLGSRAENLTERELSRCVVRRERSDAADVVGVPTIMPVLSCEFPDDPDLVTRLMNLPPPLPAREGESGGAFINRGLVHQWSSSEAALRDAIRRRVAKATALIASLRAGRYPSAVELEAWTFADGALQLGFAELLAPPTPDADALLESVSAHAKAIELLLQDSADAGSIDGARASALIRIRNENPGAKIVAFAQYASTVAALFRRVAGCGGVAMLTADGGRVVGGKLTREDTIARFAPNANHAPPPSRAEAIDLLLTTDLLSEGVNLQDAEIVMHLDVPWTAARMEQRVGRAARMGSRHSRVRVYQFRPPISAENVLRGEALVSAKFDIARRAVGAGRFGPLADTDRAAPFASSIPSLAEQLRTILGRWIRTERDAGLADRHTQTATVIVGQPGFIAAGYLGDTPLLLSCLAKTVSMNLDAQIAGCLLAEGIDGRVDPTDCEAALNALQHWVDNYSASEYAGASVAAPAGRKRLLQRIDATLQRVPPHIRASRARSAATARQIASASHGAAIEDDLRVLADSTLSDDEWLSALAAVASPVDRARPLHEGFRLIALLVFKP